MNAVFFKRYFSFIYIVLTIVACNSPASISGKIEGVVKKDLKIYIIQPENLEDVAVSYFGKIIDSAAVNSDVSFNFNNLPIS